MLKTKSMNLINFKGIIALIVITLMPCGVVAKEDNSLTDKVVVGVVDLPPFAMKSPDGRWEGLGIDLWRAAAHEMGVKFEFREFNGVEANATAIKNEEIDVIPVASVSPVLERVMDFTNHYYRTGLGIAVRTENTGFGWWGFVDRLLSRAFLLVIGALFLLWAAAGTLVWLFEKRRNPDMFGERFIHGLGHGIWWAAVTMTTVGYGDKAPKTTGGRIVAVVWMFASIIVISSFTAAITTSLTVSQLSGKVRGVNDLPNVRVGSLAHSWGYTWLQNRGITALPFDNDRDGLQALVDSTIGAFVHDDAILTYLVKTKDPTRLHVLPGTFEPYYISMAIPPDSRLREPLNRSILKFMDTEDWNRLVKQYFGPGGG